MTGLIQMKFVLRCASMERSRDFYTRVLGFAVLEAWTEEEGRGCILGLRQNDPAAVFEIYEMTACDRRFHPAFTRRLEIDKIDLQLRTDSVDHWITGLSGMWPFTGPEILPWGQRWIQLRDPDNLLIAIYEELNG